jgi:hypothetical protein
MATKRAMPDEVFEGHGDASPAPELKKGSFLQVGTATPISTKGISPNVKTGTSSGSEQ